MLKCTHGRKRVLLVEDDHTVSQTLSMLLTTRGYDVRKAHSAEGAFQQLVPPPDIILLDLVLPDQEGFEVCRKLKENAETRLIPIIITSGKLLNEDIVEALYLGADDYLTKPYECDVLVARMEAVMRRSSWAGSGFLESRGEEAIVRELRRIISQKLIIPHFQPIFLLKPGRLLGVEALSRPQTKGMLSNPEVLFKAAMQFGMYQDLELVSWEKMLEKASTFLTGEKLFLNCNPYLVEGPKFLAIKSLFDQYHIAVNNVVLEITERSVISQYKVFYEHLEIYRQHGFQFAVDDVGGGYASLESIVETRPEVVKIDRHIVNGIGQDSFKMSIVRFVVAFCKENGILSIAEGIEVEEDLQALIDLGVDAGQGYYLGKPAAEVDFRHCQKTAQKLSV